MELLQSYDFVICYRPGPTNIADALTRKPEYNMVTTATVQLPKQDLIKGYQEDVYFAPIYQALTKPQEAAAPHIKSQIGCYQVLAELLYLKQQGDTPLQLCVPDAQDLHTGLLHDHHDAPIADHLGIDKTYSTLARHYF